MGMEVHPGASAANDPKAEPIVSKAPLKIMKAEFPVLPMHERRYDFFINHCQASGQDQAGKLRMLLAQAGASVWYDMSATDLTARGMEEAVHNSRCVLIFLSDDVMARPFCNAEQ